jgi:hypothetical protein
MLGASIADDYGNNVNGNEIETISGNSNIVSPEEEPLLKVLTTDFAYTLIQL